MMPPATAISELENLLRHEKDVEQCDRLRAIVMGLQGFVSDEIAVRLGRSRRFVQKWAAIYRLEGIGRVRERRVPGAKSKLGPEEEVQFAREINAVLNAKGHIRGKQVVQLLSEKFDQNYSLQGAYELMNRLGLPIRHPRVERERARGAVVPKGRSGFAPERWRAVAGFGGGGDDNGQGTAHVLTAALDCVHDGVWVTDLAGRTLLWNAEFLKLWGIPPALAITREHAGVLARMLAQVRDPSDLLALSQPPQAVSAESSSAELALRDGRFFDGQSRPYLAGGRIVGRMWAFRDATARVNAELALRTHGQRHAQVSAALTDLMEHMETLDCRDTRAMPRVVAECLTHALGVARAGVWFLSDEDTCLRCDDLYDARVGAYVQPVTWLASQCPYYFAAIARKRDVVAHDALAHPVTAAMAAEYLEPAGIASLLDAPVCREGRVVGVVRLEQTASGVRRFASEDSLMAGMVAGLVARHLGEIALRQAEGAQAQARVAVRPDHSMAPPWKNFSPNATP